MLTSFIDQLTRSIPATIMLALMIAPVEADTLVFHASLSGHQTRDQGEGGGNPFASALIEALGSPLELSDLPARLLRLTAKKSRGFQSADVPNVVGGSFSVVPAKAGERRIALVLVVADYAASEGGFQSLPGAAHDADRIARALERAGFETELALDLDLRAMRTKLAEFGKRSFHADAAAIYTTGHGVEVDGSIFLLPGNYPLAELDSVLVKRALALREVAGSIRARQVNLVFYGGCRDNPFR